MIRASYCSKGCEDSLAPLSRTYAETTQLRNRLLASTIGAGTPGGRRRTTPSRPLVVATNLEFAVSRRGVRLLAWAERRGVAIGFALTRG